MGYDATATLGYGVQFTKVEELGGTENAVDLPEWVFDEEWDDDSDPFSYIGHMTSGDGRGATCTSTLYFLRSGITVDTYEGTRRVPMLDNPLFLPTHEECSAMANILDKLAKENYEIYSPREWGWFMATLYI